MRQAAIAVSPHAQRVNDRVQQDFKKERHYFLAERIRHADPIRDLIARAALRDDRTFGDRVKRELPFF